MRTNNWTAATNKYYNFASLSDLQVTWVNWVGEGSPAMAPRSIEGLAAGQPPPSDTDQPTTAESFAMARQASAYGWQAPPAQNARALARANSMVQPPAPSNFAASSAVDENRPGASNVSRPVSDGWYARRRDQARGANAPDETEPTSTTRAIPSPPTRDAIDEPLRRASFESPIPAPARPAPAPGNRKVLMEWRREPADQGRTDVRDLAVQETRSLQ